tara:strand:+ start:512 stop:703 length:192 start_codon:yes stop_codon:yes gene_type:complete
MTSKKTKCQQTQTQRQFDKVNEKEKEFLQSQMKTNTRNFWTPQSFGAASEVRQISVEEYLRDQ